MTYGLVYPIIVMACGQMWWEKQENRWRIWWICVEQECQLARVKYDRGGEGGREALGVGNCSINIWDESELELARYKKSSSYFENDFPIS